MVNNSWKSGEHTTLPETNIAPENWWLEDYFPFGEAYFQSVLVSFREGNTPSLKKIEDIESSPSSSSSSSSSPPPPSSSSSSINPLWTILIQQKSIYLLPKWLVHGFHHPQLELHPVTQHVPHLALVTSAQVNKVHHLTVTHCIEIVKTGVLISLKQLLELTKGHYTPWN